MKQETIEKAVKVINRSIKFNQRQLGYRDGHIEKYEIILVDLDTIKRAIKNNKTSVRIYGTAYNRGNIYTGNNRDYIYTETVEVLQRAGFYTNIDKFGTLELSSIDEEEEELVEGTPESWSAYEEEQMAMQLNGLMAEFEK